MNPAAKPSKSVLEIRKYPNRRYYDATRSRHLTLEQIRDAIREGYDIRVTDSQTSADITAKMLAQIILDLDAPKLELFPTAFLAQLIRVNDQLVKGFYEKFFHQAQEAFLDYQRLVESQLRQGSMLPTMFPPMAAWTQALMHPFGTPSQGADKPPAAPDLPKDDPLAAKLAELERQVQELKGHKDAPAGRARRKAGRKP